MGQIMTAPLGADAYEQIRDEIHRNATEALNRMGDLKDTACRGRNRRLGRDLAWMRIPYHRGPLKRLADAIETAWALLYGMFIVYSEMLGLIEEVGDDE